jgi:hypothetical protein
VPLELLLGPGDYSEALVSFGFIHFQLTSRRCRFSKNIFTNIDNKEVATSLDLLYLLIFLTFFSEKLLTIP